jgi:ATP-binding cassette subfamily F protein 3
MELEEELKIENEKLVKASNTGDNATMIDASKNVGKVQKEVDDFFERLEVASEALDEIEEKYKLKLNELK